MIRPCTVAVLGLLCLPAMALAQPANPMAAAIRSQHDMIKSNLVKSAEQMSEADYAFKPTPEVRSFGQLVGHVANANYMICAMALGDKSPAAADIEKTVTGKAALAKALGDAVAFCEGAMAKLTAASALEEVKVFGTAQPRLAVFALNNSHNMEHYGNMVTYMRLKGLVPPSSAQP